MNRISEVGKGAFSTPGMAGGEVGARRADRELGAWIGYQLRRREISQKDIAIAIGVTQQMVQRVSYGVVTSARVQKAISAALGYKSWTELTSRCTECERGAA